MAFLTPPPPPIAAQAVSVNQPTRHAASSGTASPASTDQTVQSHGYRYIVVDNRLLPQAQVRASLLGQKTPKAAVGALKKVYEQHGYFLVALVGEEKGHQVLIHVVQGRITHVEGPKSLTLFFTGLKGNDKLRRHMVVRRAILARAWAKTNNKQPEISFRPAPEVGGSTMQVATAPLAGSHTFGGGVAFGDFGNRYAGRYIMQANVSAHHDGFSADVGYAQALPWVSSSADGGKYKSGSGRLSWVTPLGIFGLDGSQTRYHLGGPFTSIDLAGRVNVLGATGTQLLYASTTTRWSLSEGVHRIHEQDTVFSGSFALYDHRFTVGNITSSWSRRFVGLGAHSAAVETDFGIKHGLGGSGFVTGPGQPVEHFTVYTGSFNVTQTLPDAYSLKLGLSGQSTPNTLPSYEQWVLGGFGNLTAYLPGTVAGDRGYLGSLTLTAPNWHVGWLTMQPAVFVEHGASRSSFVPADAPTWQRLTDGGVSLRLGVPAAHTNVSLAVAKPIGSQGVPESVRANQRLHVFFLVQANF